MHTYAMSLHYYCAMGIADVHVIINQVITIMAFQNNIWNVDNK